MIQVNTIDGGADAFDALVYPMQNPLDMSYYKENLNNLYDNIVGSVSSSFLDTTKQMYDNIYNSEAITIARNALSKATGFMRPDVIVSTSIEQLNNATGIMQRYIMAEPTIRDMYLNNKCDGYYESYVNSFGDDIKEDHYDYRRVMDGVMDFEGDHWVITSYTDTTDFIDEEDLSVHDQLDILYTWDNVALAIANGDDPTNPDKGRL